MLFVYLLSVRSRLGNYIGEEEKKENEGINKKNSYDKRRKKA